MEAWDYADNRYDRSSKTVPNIASQIKYTGNGRN